tara:strand:- start:8 stop:613 length:606 start_codon:yes stop_codon:yes gene_type:complete
MEVTLITKDMYRVRDFFTVDEVSGIMDEFSEYRPSVRKKEKSNNIIDYFESLEKGPGELGDNMALIGPSVKIGLGIKKIVKPEHPIDFIRVNTNIMHPGQNSDFHHDAPRLECGAMEYSWTFLLFASPYWDTHWGGEFCMQDEVDDYHYCAYIPGDCVLFRGCRYHKGNGPITTAPTSRHTVAWTYSSYGILDETDTSINT